MMSDKPAGSAADRQYADPATVDLGALERDRRALEAALGREMFERANGYFRREHAWLLGRVVYGLVAHLPGMGPAIHGLADHVIDGDCESGCCGLPPVS